MTASTEPRPAQPPRVLTTLGSYLRGRRGLIVAALMIVAAGLYLGWGWLAAAGIAPVLVALAPCAAMCALGLCMNKMGGKSCSTESQSKGDRNA
jgi:hypothetical protein